METIKKLEIRVNDGKQIKAQFDFGRGVEVDTCIILNAVDVAEKAFCDFINEHGTKVVD